jgi:hypothetical protein
MLAFFVQFNPAHLTYRQVGGSLDKHSSKTEILSRESPLDRALRKYFYTPAKGDA